MRMILPVVLLLFTATSAYSQAQTSSTSPVESRVPVQAPVQPLPVAPAPALPEDPSKSSASTHAEAQTAAEQAQPEEPRKRSRILWILVGAVAVLAIIVAAS